MTLLNAVAREAPCPVRAGPVAERRCVPGWWPSAGACPGGGRAPVRRTDDGSMRRVTLHHLSSLVAETAGSPVVLLHGLAGSAREMAITLPGHRVIAPDQRGHGHSIRRPAEV